MRTQYRIILFLLLFLGILVTTNSQVLPFRTYTTKDGLLSNVINCLYQDSQGYIWIGSAEGLTRYDGRTFKNYTPAEGLPFNAISDIIEDKTSPGTLWIATQGGGLGMFRNEVFQRFLLDTGYNALNVSGLVQDNSNQIWCATGNGIYIFNKGNIQKFAPEKFSASIIDIAFEGDSILWASELSALHRIGIKSYRDLKYDLPIDDSIVPYSTPLFMGGDMKLWVGHTNGTITLFENGKKINSRNFGQGPIVRILEDIDEFLWICTFNGVSKISKKTFFESSPLVLTKENGLIATDTKCFLIDKELNFWFGSSTFGISKLTNKKIFTFSVKPTPPTPNNTTSSMDRSNRIWVCSYSGLYEFWKTTDGEWKYYLHDSNLYGVPAQRHPVSVQFDSKNRCWVLFSDANFERYDAIRYDDKQSLLTRSKIFKTEPIIGKTFPFFFILDSDDRIWYADANRGVFIFNSELKLPLLRLITPKDGLPNVAIRSLYQDRAGKMWFGGNGDGLAYLSLSHFLQDSLTRYTEVDGLASNAIRSLYQDTNGRLWIGTRYNGLSILQNGYFSNLDVRNGLTSNTIWRIAEDSAGRLWFGTPTGVMYIENIESRLFRSFERQLISEQISGLGATKSGEVWCLSADHLTILDPGQKTTTAIPPPVYITQCTVNGKPVQYTQPLKLTHDQNNIVIDFIGLGFRDETEIRYEYRLFGADMGWQMAKKENTISYAALQPGRYSFDVIAVNSDGIKSVKPAVLQFTIISPFWQRWWFIGGSILMVFASAFALYRYRVYQLLLLERLRTRIARDLHDDIGSTLSSISIFSEMARKEIETVAPKSNQLLGRIGDNSRSLIEAMDDIVWAINPDNDSLDEAIERIREFATEMFEAKNIAFTIQLPNDHRYQKLSMEARKNIFLIAKEAINNVVKHSRCTSASVVFKRENNELELVVSDNGVGITTNIAFGNGLKNMERRAQSLGGTLTIISSGGNGTTTTLRLKIT